MVALGLSLLCLLGIGVGLLIYSTARLGPGIDTDSVNYLSAATSLAHGRGYLGWDGELLPYFPPGYPIVVALGRLVTGVGVQQVAQWADVALFAALVLATYLLASRVVTSAPIRLLVTALVALSPFVLQVYGLVSSETVFNFLCLAGLVVVLEVRRPNPTSPARYLAMLGLLAAIASFALLTRLAGLALVLSLAIALIVLGSTGRHWISRAAEGVVFFVVTVAPVGFWDLFLHSRTGSWTFGNRPPSTSGIGANIGTAAHTLAGWPSPISGLLPGLAWLDVVAAAVLVVALAIGLGQVVRTPHLRLRNVAPVLIFCLVYPAFLIFTSTRVDLVGALDDRYMSPMLAPLVVLGGFALELVWLRANRSGSVARSLAGVVTGVVVLSLLSSGVASARAAQQGHADGLSGVTRADWNGMSVVRSARSLPNGDGQILLSNLPEMLSYSTGRPYRYPPFRGGGVPDDLRQLVALNGPAYLALVSSEPDPDLYTPDELAQWFTVRVVDSSPDGQLIELSRP